MSTVTTATVDAVTRAGGVGFASGLGAAAVLTFLALLIIREAVGVAPDPRARRLVRGLTIGLVPLGMAFAAIVVASLAQVVG
mgnify:CR=1 FL=1